MWGPRESCAIWAAPGQVASGSTLQHDDLLAQGAETPFDEKATKAALQGEGCQIQDMPPHALQQLVQVLLKEELRVGGKY